MGYTTIFKGRFEFDREIDPQLADYINNFAKIRHVKRSVSAYKELHPDWQQKCFDGNPGKDGEYIIDGKMWVEPNSDVIDHNEPPGNCPGLWCQWIVKNRKYLQWDGGEKFYKYTEWLEYLIKNFIAPKGYVLNGKVSYQGEDVDDKGFIEVVNNKVIVT